MTDHTETRLRFIGAGLQTTLLGIAFPDVFGLVLIFLGTLITLGGLV